MTCCGRSELLIRHGRDRRRETLCQALASPVHVVLKGGPAIFASEPKHPLPRATSIPTKCSTLLSLRRYTPIFPFRRTFPNQRKCGEIRQRILCFTRSSKVAKVVFGTTIFLSAMLQSPLLYRCFPVYTILQYQHLCVSRASGSCARIRNVQCWRG